jgi:hypothetical protein
MKRIISAALLGMLTYAAGAQTKPATPETQAYGKIDQADLELKACDFEKDANAEVLFNKANVYFGGDLMTITEDIHKRIKIFNDNGKKEADIHIKYWSADHLEYINGLQAETINLVDGKVQITKLDKKQLFTKTIDKYTSEISFTMPDVKPGSVIEFKYSWNTNAFYDMPDWQFQEKLPVRYSEFTVGIPDIFYFRPQPRLSLALSKMATKTDGRSLVIDGQGYPYNIDVTTRGMSNIPSLRDEPFMSSYVDNVQSIRFQLVTIKPIGGFAKNYSDTWAKVAGRLEDDDDFGGQLKRKLANEDVVIAKAKSFKTDDQRIAYVFGEVKNAMKWNDVDDWYTNNGTVKAWETKTGNSAEINLILYHLLKQSGVDAYPMVVSTRDNGKVIPYYTSVAQFNRAVVYIPVDSTRNYVLDATSKYNIYNETPADILNSSGLYIDKQKNVYDMIYIKKDQPARQTVLINAEIKPGGKLEGEAQIGSSSYNRISAIERYKKDGEKKYIDYLRNDDNNLKINSISFENMDVDTLPLAQKVNFSLDLAGSDENYIYLNPNLFTPLKSNPFLSENRATDIDFGYQRSYSINGVFKEPAGYKVEALPKSISMVMPDKSVSFRRLVAEQDGTIVVRFVINYNQAEYSKDNYPDFHEFFKKMHEMLNEQIILKKS